jgi:Tol biopolymer transport system component
MLLLFTLTACINTESPPGSTSTGSNTASPPSSPTSEKLAFAKTIPVGNAKFQIYVMDINGISQLRITNSAEGCSKPVWSPDGNKIAFVSRNQFQGDIYVTDVNGTEELRLTDNPAYDSNPSWSPDGAQILFTSDRDLNENNEAGATEIYVMNADGSNQTRLTFDEARKDDPRWSPDGSKVVYTSTISGQFEIYVMNIDGKEQIKLTDSQPGYSNFTPSWSPDGKKIVFEVVNSNDSNNTRHEICVINADGSDRIELIGYQSGPNLFPSWSPDGQKIIFVSGHDYPGQGITNLYTIDSDGSNLVRLTKDTTRVRYESPVWTK